MLMWYLVPHNTTKKLCDAMYVIKNQHQKLIACILFFSDNNKSMVPFQTTHLSCMIISTCIYVYILDLAHIGVLMKCKDTFSFSP